MAEFDLLTRAWIPSRDLRGRQCLLGLGELLERADHLADIEAPVPPGYAALWHVLTALTYRITGLDQQEDTEEWKERRARWLEHGTLTSPPTALRAAGLPGGEPNPVRAYFTRWAERFGLFGERPFLQDRRLATQCPEPSGVNKFVLGRPAGDNGRIWWTHHHKGDQRAITPQEAAWWLLVQWFYGAAGQITARKVNGKQTSSSRSGMLRGSISYYPRGATLARSLLLSLIPPALARPEEVSTAGPDLCPWERESGPDPAMACPIPGGMCSLLTSVHAHAFLLVPDNEGDVVDVYRTWAYQLPAPERKAENPFLSYHRNDRKQRRAEPWRALWRDFDALLPEASAGAGGETVAASDYLAPRFLSEAGVGEVAARRQGLTAVGFHQDPKTVDYAWWLATAPPQFMALYVRVCDEPDPTLRAAATETVRHLLQLFAEEQKLLTDSLRRAWRDGVRSAPRSTLNQVWPTRAASRFWTQAEEVFYERLDAEFTALGQPDPRERAAWEREESKVRVRALVRSVYDETTALVTGESALTADFVLRREVIRNRPRPHSNHVTAGRQ